MGPPSIVPLISPDLMVKNLPAPPPPPSINIISDPQTAMNLNPDVPEFVPRSSPLELKTEKNCDTNDCEQMKNDIENNISFSSSENIVTTIDQHSTYGNINI